MDIKVSVTVPIYNAEPYLCQCLDALKVQTLKEIEFILIDDYSSDNSPVICDKYAASDERFKVIHRKQNGGSASARQDGVDVAKGEYLIVCDSDDWPEPTLYEQLYENAKKNDSDISTCDYFINYDNGREIICHYDMSSSNEEIMKDCLTQRLPSASWVKLVRRSFIIDNNIHYEEGINQGEDYLILIKMLLFKPRITKIDIPLYHYRRVRSGNSYTNAPKYSSYLQMLRIEQWILNNLDNRKYEYELFHASINNAYLGLRAKNIPIVEHKKYMSECCSWNSFFRFRRFDLKALVIMLSKISRPIGIFLYKTLSGFFYR